MVTNAGLARKVTKQRERNRLLEEALMAMKTKIDEVIETIDKVKEKLEDGEDKGKEVDEEDLIPELDPLLQEEPFLKATKALGDKYLEGMPLFNGKMD